MQFIWIILFRISGIIPEVGSINDDIGGTFPSIERYIGRHFETQAGVLLRFSFSRTGSSNFTPILNSWMIFMICMIFVLLLWISKIYKICMILKSIFNIVVFFNILK